MIIIALSGLKFAGKGTLASVAARDHKYGVYRTRDRILEDAADYGIVKPREEISIAEMQHIGNAGRAKGGSGYWAKRIFDEARTTECERFLMDGVRHPEEFNSLRNAASEAATFDKQLFDGPIPLVVWIGIEAPTMTRFSRTSGRNEEGDVAMRDIAAFLTMDDTDRGIGQPWDGQQVDACMAAARRLAARTETPGTLMQDLAKAEEVKAMNGAAPCISIGYILRNDGDINQYRINIRDVLADIEVKYAQLPSV